MTRFLRTLAAFVLGAPLIVGAAQGQSAAGGAQKADPAITKIRDAYLAATKARDATNVAELYAEDAVEMPPHQQIVKGRAAIRSYYEKQFKGGEAEFSDLQLQGIDSRVAGDMGYDVGTYRQKITPKGGKPMEDSGNFAVILQRAADGQWRIKYAIYNSHMPPSGASKLP